MMRNRLSHPVRLQAFRLRILRAQAARLMMSLREAGLHEAAAHVSTGIKAIDRAALEEEPPNVERLH